MSLFNNIVVAVDFSPFSQEAMRVAAGLAQAFGGKVLTLYVSDTPKGVDPALMVRSRRAIDSLLTLQKEASKAGRDKLERWAGHYEWGQAEITVDVEQGSPSGRVVARAKEMEADLIVMGTHGRSGFAQRYFGTTTEKVVRKANCSVLAVTLPKQE